MRNCIRGNRFFLYEQDSSLSQLQIHPNRKAYVARGRNSNGKAIERTRMLKRRVVSRGAGLRGRRGLLRSRVKRSKVKKSENRRFGISIPESCKGGVSKANAFAYIIFGPAKSNYLFFSSAWLGTAPVHTAWATVAAVLAQATSALPLSTAGRTTQTSTRLAGCSGRSSRNTATGSRGQT